jgi:hypothetical protein
MVSEVDIRAAISSDLGYGSSNETTCSKGTVLRSTNGMDIFASSSFKGAPQEGSAPRSQAEREPVQASMGAYFASSDRYGRMQRVEFRVTREVPPRRVGGRSIWRTRSEIPRIVALREAALKAMRGSAPLSGEISLMLEVHIPWVALYCADVTDVVHGVCLSLSRAGPRARLGPAWDAPELAPIHPTICVAIVESARVTFIHAQKIPYHRGESWYRVVLEGEP